MTPQELHPRRQADPAANHAAGSPLRSNAVVSLAQLLRQPPTPQPAFIEPSVLPHQGILFVGGEPKVGKSLLVTNLALCLAAGSSRLGFRVPQPARVLICQFELPQEQFAARILPMRDAVGDRADQRLLIDTRSSGNLLNTHKGFNHFLSIARDVQAQVIVLDPLYAAHDRDENDTRSMSALCQNLLRLRDDSKASLIVVHHIRKSANRNEVGSAFRGSSALHAVGDSYMLLRRRSPHNTAVDVHFQFRYDAPPPPKRLSLHPQSLWFSDSDHPPEIQPPSRRKVQSLDVQRCFHQPLLPLGFNQLRQQIMESARCSKRTAQLAIKRACADGVIHQVGKQYRLPL